MFNSKKIKDLEERIALQAEYFGDRLWKLENPPKYKVGDKTKTGIICEVKIMNYKYREMPVRYWSYNEVRVNDNKTYDVK